jgi:hypothetical protein
MLLLGMFGIGFRAKCLYPLPLVRGKDWRRQPDLPLRMLRGFRLLT